MNTSFLSEISYANIFLFVYTFVSNYTVANDQGPSSKTVSYTLEILRYSALSQDPFVAYLRIEVTEWNHKLQRK